MTETAETFVATFYPQAWQNNHAVDVDAEGETQFLVNAKEVEAARASDLDALKNAPSAPQWIRDWKGPFLIKVEPASQTTYDANALDSKSQTNRLDAAQPDAARHLAEPTRRVKIKIQETVFYEMEADIPEHLFEGDDEIPEYPGEELNDWIDDFIVNNLDPISHFTSCEDRDFTLHAKDAE